MITLESTVCRGPNLLGADMDGEFALMSVDSGRYYCLNPTGRQIWELMEQPRDAQGICRHLLAEYDVAPEQCEADVLELLGKLSDEKLIEVRDAEAA